MRKDAVVLTMVFMLGLLVGVLVSGGILGSMFLTGSRQAEMMAAEMRAVEAESRAVAEQQRKRAEAALAEAEQQRKAAEEEIAKLKMRIKELEAQLKKD